MRARGLNDPCAYDLATSQLRIANQELFARLLADEIRCCLSEAGIPDFPVACEACGGTSWQRSRHVCAEPCGLVHLRCLGCGMAAGSCYWASVSAAVALLIVHRVTIMGALLDAIASRRPPGNCRACQDKRCPRHAADQELAGQYQSLAEEMQEHLAAVGELHPAAYSSGPSTVHGNPPDPLNVSGLPRGPVPASQEAR